MSYMAELESQKETLAEHLMTLSHEEFTEKLSQMSAFIEENKPDENEENGFAVLSHFFEISAFYEVVLAELNRRQGLLAQGIDEDRTRNHSDDNSY